MGILDVEDRIVLRRFDHLGEVEVHLRVVLARQHGEADDVLADFLDDLGQGDEAARALGHLDQLAVAQQPDHLHQLDVERRRPSVSASTAAWVRLTVPAWSAPQMFDQLVATSRLLHVIGGVGGEIGPAAVGLLDRPILIVAELGRTEQQSAPPAPSHRAVLPLRRRRACPRRPGPCSRSTLQRAIDRARFLTSRFRREQVVVDAEQAEVVPDQVEHRLDRASRNRSSHSLSGAPTYWSPNSAGELAPDRLQIIAGVQALGDLADVLAERLAVSEMHRAGERIDLRAGVVDIIFLGDPEAGRLEQPREAVADHGAAAMAHVQRTGRIGRDIFDVDPLVGADRRQAIVARPREGSCAARRARRPRQADIDEARARRSRRRSPAGSASSFGLISFGQRARVGARGLGQHHRGVGREVAVRGIARRLDRHVLAVELRRQRAVGNEIVEHSVEERGILGVEAQFAFTNAGKRRL